MTAGTLAADLLAPLPGRLSRSLEICAASTLVVIVSMTYGIPSPDVSAYVIFFAAKENSGLNIVTSIVFIVLVTIVVALLLLIAPIAVNHPVLRIGIIGLASFIAFFLGSATKLAPVAGTVGLVVAYALDLLQDSFVGEVATRGLLYAWLFVAVPMGVFIAFSLVFGHHPEALLRAGLAERLRLCGQALEGRADVVVVEASLEDGDRAFRSDLAMVRLFRRDTADVAARLAALVVLSYALLLTVSTLMDQAQALPAILAPRLRALAARVEHLPREVPSRPDQFGAGQETMPETQIAALVGAMEAIVAGGTIPNVPSAPKRKTGFFVADAFSNPDHTRFALKGAAAVLVCYLVFNLLDWPGIHTCLITCFIVALKTLGETLQKMLLRLVGCLVGAALGLAVIVELLPGLTSITGLAVAMAVLTFPAAWIAVGKPRVAYIGFQIAFALDLCVLQGTGPAFDLTLARDRVIGILIGNGVIYLIFTRVFPVSILHATRTDFAELIARCRAVLKASQPVRPPTAWAGDVAHLQTMLEAFDTKVDALELENRRRPEARLYAQATRLSDKALHEVVRRIGHVASLSGGAGAAQPQLRRSLLEIDDALGSLLNRSWAAPSAEHASGPPEVAEAVLVDDDPANSDAVARALRTCALSVNRLSAATARYRRLLRLARADA